MKVENKIKTGISLIVLIISIVIIVILSVAALLTISKTDIISNAKKASTSYSKESIKEKIIVDLLTKGIEKNRNLSYDEIKEALQEYGELTYEDGNKKIIRGVFVKEINSEILLSDLDNKYSLPYIEDFEYNFDITLAATQAQKEEAKVDDLTSEYSILNVGYTRTGTDVAWFTDSVTLKDLKLTYYNIDVEKKKSSINYRKVILPSGNLKIELEGNIKEWKEENLKWNKVISKEVIIKNTGTLYSKFMFCINGENNNINDNVQKYLKIRIKDENGIVIKEYSPKEAFSGQALISGELEKGEEQKYILEFEMHYDI